jgi:hypothetical protein
MRARRGVVTEGSSDRPSRAAPLTAEAEAEAEAEPKAIVPPYLIRSAIQPFYESHGITKQNTVTE